MTLSGPLLRVEGLPFQSLGGQILVVVSKTREVHLLNETAARIWELLERARSLPDLLGALGEEFDLDPLQAEGEIESVLEEMKEKGLIGSVSTASGR